MKFTISSLAFVVGLGLAGGSLAQTPPVGGPTAKGNAPIKHMHTINDGAAKRGANSFTQNQARKHILNSGYSDVSGLAKDSDGVWRGVAVKGGASVNVALDFKGNVTEGGPAGSTAGASSSSSTTTTTTSAQTGAHPSRAPGASTDGRSAGGDHHHRHHGKGRHHRGRHGGTRCADPGPNGAACSGRDRNRNGISDKEDRAIKGGAKP